MIVKNEEKNLQDCLDSVKDVVDEIVIVDTGSTDKTLDIAKSFNANIFHFKWTDDFSAARNFALQNSTGNFILYLDADEVLSENSKNQISELSKSNEKIGYLCKVKSIDEYSNQNNEIRYIRFFKNSEKIKFTGKVHEQISDSLIANDYKIIDSDIEIIHYGYNIPKDKKKLKAIRNLNLLLNDFTNTKSSYVAFQIGQSYIVLEKFTEAEKYFKISIDSKSLPNDLKSECYYYLAQIAHNKFDISSSENFIQKALTLDNKKPFFHFLHGKILQRKQEYNNSFKAFIKALELNKKVDLKGTHNLQISYLNELEVMYSGINLALLIQEKSMLQLFIEKLIQFIHKRYFEHYKTYLLFTKILLNNSLLNKESFNDIFEIISNDNLQTILQILDTTNDLNLKTEILMQLYSIFPDDIEVIKKMALDFNSQGRVDKSIELLEKNYNIISNEPTCLFYLASFYIKKNNYKNALETFDTIIKRFPYVLSLTNKVNEIRNKIEALMKS